MASKGPRSKLDHETRARRQKALEASREPRRPKTHWDHVLEEMIWLSKDFEAERKWKLAQAKKVALRASRGMLDQATRGEKRMKEEEQRMRKVALNISKDVKKFWTKIEKLVLYKHQLELDDKKKKALDKQLEYLLGQTERYSNMLAENLVGSSNSYPSGQPSLNDNIQQNNIDSNIVDRSVVLLGDSKSDTEIKADELGVDVVPATSSQNLLNSSHSCSTELSTQENTFLSQEKTDEVKVSESLKLLAACTEGKSDSEIKIDDVEADEDYDVQSDDEKMMSVPLSKMRL